MEQSREVISSFRDAQDNAIHFNQYLSQNSALQYKLSQYRQWYYFEKKGLFAPSKFIGYKNNSYQSESAHEGDGRETEKALSRLFRKVIPSPEQQDIYVNELYARLTALLHKYGKKLNARAVIHIPRENIRQ